jgi:hypothetical protein
MAMLCFAMLVTCLHACCLLAVLAAAATAFACLLLALLGCCRYLHVLLPLLAQLYQAAPSAPGLSSEPRRHSTAVHARTRGKIGEPLPPLPPPSLISFSCKLYFMIFVFPE